MPMSKMHVSIRHTLTETEVLKRIKKLLTETKKEYGNLVSELKEKWTGKTGEFSFSIKGYSIKGTIVVGSPTIELDGELPGALGFFKGKIERLIRERAETLLK